MLCHLVRDIQSMSELSQPSVAAQAIRDVNQIQAACSPAEDF